jgi:hypothetical protein
MNPIRNRSSRAFLYFAFVSLLAVHLCAQQAPSPAAKPVNATKESDPASEAAIELSPFEVTASSDMGYQATETLAGSRLKTELKDVATQVNVMTREFMEDLAITNLDDAMQYSLNTETRFEILDVNDPNGMGLEDSLNVIGGGQGGRTRGLSAPNNSHDFFDTFVRMDSYSTERFTFSSGPNSILFGNSGPAGTIDTTFKRAQPRKQMFEVSTRANVTTGSVRLSTDLNQPLLKDKLALRVAGLTDRDKNWRKPAFFNQDRLYATLAYTPAKWLAVRAYHERGRFNQQAPKNTLLQDHVTPWIEAGRPMFNNYIISGYPNNALPRGDATANMPSIGSISGNSLRRPNAPVRPVISYDANGFLGNPIVQHQFSALGVGYNDLIPAPDNLERSITDPSIYPFDRSFNGNASQAKFYTWVRGAIIELNPLKSFFIEAGFNEEQSRSRAVEFMNGGVHQLQVDPNLYLEDRVTPNPKAGHFYVENAFGGRNSNAGKNFGSKEQKRVSFSYELNFEERNGWTKWLGLHRTALLFDRLESTLVRAISLFNVSPFTNPGVAGVPYSFVTAGAGNALNSQRPAFRYYIDPAKGDWSVRLPFDIMSDGVFTQPGWVDANGKQVYLAMFDPSVGANTPSTARNRVDSSSFVTQSYFLGRRVVVSYGRRRDAVDIFQDPAPQANWNFDELLRTIDWQKVVHEVPVNTVKSAVVHPLRWVSFAYSETTSKQVRTEVVRNPDGSIVPTGSGIGKDYGITLRYKNWFSVRINKYDNSGLGNWSSVANSNTPTQAASGQFGPNFRTTIAALERSIQANAPDFDPNNPYVAPPSTLSPRFSYYQKDLARVSQVAAAIGGEISGRYAVNSDSVAKGYELTLTSNPTSNWRIAVTGAKNTASESNIGGQWWDFIKERLPIWGAAANLDPNNTALNQVGVPANVVVTTAGSGLSQNYRTYSQVLAAAMANWNYIRLSEGRLNNNIRKYRFTATSRYTFNRDGLKGVFVGGNYAWRSPSAVGYPITTSTDNPFEIPGINTSEVSVSDVSRPYWGGALTSFDAFIGYSRRLADGKARWRLQLNVRNVLNRDKLLVQRVSTDGVGVNFTPQQPRSFILTNTFSF